MDESAVKVMRMSRGKSSLDAEKSREIIKKIIEDFLRLALISQEYYSVGVEIGEVTTQFIVDVAQRDFGRLLGAKGKTISALRTLVSAMAMSQGFRAVVAIKDEERFF